MFRGNGRKSKRHTPGSAEEILREVDSPETTRRGMLSDSFRLPNKEEREAIRRAAAGARIGQLDKPKDIGSSNLLSVFVPQQVPQSPEQPSEESRDSTPTPEKPASPPRKAIEFEESPVFLTLSEEEIAARAVQAAAKPKVIHFDDVSRVDGAGSTPFDVSRITLRELK